MKVFFSVSSTLIAGLFVAASAAHLTYADEDPDLKQGDTGWVKIDEMHPTQFRLGKDEEDSKAKAFESLSANQLKKYLKTHPSPVVRGPDGYYIQDETHRTDASYDAERDHHAEAHSLRKRGNEVMFVKVIDAYPGPKNGPRKDFEKWMKKKKYCYLFDRGVKRPFSDLPKEVYKMGNDSYRSVAGFVQDIAWDKKPEDFIQFSVANWLRAKMKLSDQQVAQELKKNRIPFLKKVMALLQSNKAKSENWYLSPSHCEIKRLKKNLHDPIGD